MKNRLLLLSDLWGFTDARWVRHYALQLQKDFDLVLYDVCELAGITKQVASQEERHRFFVDGGIEIAVTKLLELEKKPVSVLAFSVGGVIAWKFALRCTVVQNLVCVSSSRLRYEQNKPDTRFFLYYGALDAFISKATFFKYLAISYQIIHHAAHEMYRQKLVAATVCARLSEMSLEKGTS
ncbi:MAG: alpha/beta hydrolase [Flavicella sp.]